MYLNYIEKYHLQKNVWYRGSYNESITKYRNPFKDKIILYNSTHKELTNGCPSNYTK